MQLRTDVPKFGLPACHRSSRPPWAQRSYGNLLFVLTGAEYDRLGLDGHPCVRLLHMASADVLLPVYFFQLVSVGGIVQRLLDREEVVAARRTVRADLDDSIITMTLNFETRAI